MCFHHKLVVMAVNCSEWLKMDGEGKWGKWELTNRASKKRFGRSNELFVCLCFMLWVYNRIFKALHCVVVKSTMVRFQYRNKKILKIIFHTNFFFPKFPFCKPKYSSGVFRHSHTNRFKKLRTPYRPHYFNYRCVHLISMHSYKTVINAR